MKMFKSLSKKSLSLILSLLMIVTVVPFTGAIEARAATTQDAWWFMKDMKITQKPGGDYSHKGTQNFDVVGETSNNIFAPFDCKVVKIYSGYDYGNTVVIQSTSKVKYADGTEDYMSMCFAHDNDISNLSVGKTISQGEVFYQTGTYGNVTGRHSHVTCIKGTYKNDMWTKNSYGNYCSPNAISPTSALFIREGTNVIDTKGLSFKTILYVTFNANGADTISESKVGVVKGSAIGRSMPSAIKSGYVFDGWYTAATGGTFVTTGTKITKSQTLYAHFVKSDSSVLQVGKVYRIQSVKSVDEGTPRYFTSNGQGAGARVTLRDFTESKTQLWRVTGVNSSGFYTFESLYGGNALDVDADGGRYTMGNQLQVWTPDGNTPQQFGIVKRDKGYSIHNIYSGRGLDCTGNTVAAGTVIQQYCYGGGTQQQFYFIEQTARYTVFNDNFSNNYLPSIADVYEANGSTPSNCYASRDTDYLTATVNADTLTIVAKKDGSTGHDMLWRSSVNGSYNFDEYNADTNTYYLSFSAKASVAGAKMYFRWGYDPTSGDNIKSITLTTDYQSYKIALPRTKNSGASLHPWIDKACTVNLKNIYLSENNGAVPLEGYTGYYSGIQERTYQSSAGTYGSLPTPANKNPGDKFDGWYTKRVGGTRLTEDTEIKYNQYYYAHWVACTHNYESETVNAPGCLADGKAKYTCPDCGDVYYKTVPALGHEWSEWEVVTAPTATQEGEEKRTCSRCGTSETRSIAPQQHVHTASEPVQENVVAATCTESGSYDEVVYCADCGEELSRSSKTVAAKGHTVVTDAAVAASCTTPGKTEGSHCSVCSTVITAQQNVPAKGHSWGEWETVTAPTESASGEEKRVCSACNAEETRVLSPLSHTHTPGTPTEENRVESTCTQDGSYDEVIYCTDCGNEMSRTKKTIASAGHTAVKDNVVLPTCVLSGKTEGSHCSVCGEIIKAQQSIAPLDHDYFTSMTAPKCTDPGYTTYTCSRCGESYKGNYTAALGHNYGEWVTVKSATETTPGEEKRWCTRCGETESRTISVLVHVHSEAQPVMENVIAATCTESGSYDEVVYCSKCGVMLSKQRKFTPATGHTVANDMSVDSTCTESGLTAGTHCSVCGKVLNPQKTTEPLGHRYSLSVVAPATCTSEGINKYTCILCGDSYTEETAKTNHSAVKDAAVAATYTTGGKTEGSHCSVCGAIIVPQYATPKLTVPETAIKKKVAGKKKFKISWKKVSGVSGYQIQYSTKKNFENGKKVFVKKASKGAKIIKKLKAKKKYYVRIRTYVKVNGKNKYSKWSKAKSVKTK